MQQERLGLTTLGSAERATDEVSEDPLLGGGGHLGRQWLGSVMSKHWVGGTVALGHMVAA